MTAQPGGWDVVVPNSLSKLFTDHRKATLRTLRRWTNDPVLAEDLCSIAWTRIVSIWRKTGGLSHVHNKRAYVMRTVRRTWISYLRDRDRRKAKVTLVCLSQDCLPDEPRRISQDETDDRDVIEALLPYLNSDQKFVLTGIAAHKSYEIIAKEICDAGLRATCSKSGVGEIVETIRKMAKKVLGFDNF